MNQYLAPSAAHPSPLPALLGRTAELLGSGAYDTAIDLLLSERQLVRGEPMACNTLAYLLIQVERPQESIDWFETCLRLRPDDMQALTGLAIALRSTGDAEQALRCYDRAIALRPDDAMLWYKRGALQADLRRLPEALSSLDRSLALKGDHVEAFVKRSHVLEALGDMPSATDSAARACLLEPGEASHWSALGDLLQKNGDLNQSIAAYERALTISSEDAACLANLGGALKLAGRPEEALERGRAALAIEPGNQQALLLCGGLEIHFGRAEAARDNFLGAAQGGIACSYPAKDQPADFKALMLFSPFAGNTPYEDLISDARFDANLVIVLENHRYDTAALTEAADVVVNLISDADLGLQMIGSLGELVASLRKPIVNHPSLIIATDRQTMSRRLATVPGVVMPKTLRIDAPELLRRLNGGESHPFPLIIRHAGTHGGEKMEVVSGPDEMRDFAQQAGDHPLYLTDFVDYRSADGFFRKYRLIFVGAEIFPYHLAIGDSWKVHHISTRMGELQWMRDEEKAFLEEPGRFFSTEAMAALDMIRRIVNLDYFGIDCSVDANGKVIVFEVNATMLIHLHNEGFEYKTPHVIKIKAAFEQLLRKRARDVSAA